MAETLAEDRPLSKSTKTFTTKATKMSEKLIQKPRSHDDAFPGFLASEIDFLSLVTRHMSLFVESLEERWLNRGIDLDALHLRCLDHLARFQIGF